MGDQRRHSSGGPCDKTSYAGRGKARRAARHISTDSGEQFRAYYCPQCRKWHVTSQSAFKKVPTRTPVKFKRGKTLKEGQTLEELAAKMRKGD